MAIDFTDPRPLYLQIVDTIKEKIESGELQPGDQISSQNELAQEYGVSLITVKKALTELILEGVLFSRVGKGTFVAQPAPSI
ncbi:MAG: GntR family transcriptional regulator, partial [candidate division KSB1 bacterium]|nr:GntR family transcriptional regulator [candidate division KSB1 bacterium]